MARSQTVARALHDVGLAAWFGGALMGAVGLNGASQEVSDPKDRARVADSGWGRWTPVGALAIGVHLLGSVALTRGTAARLAGQRAMGTAAAIKAVLTAGALGATAYARVLGQTVMDAEAAEAARDSARAHGGSAGMEVEGATHPSEGTPDTAAAAQARLQALQWAVPALTGAIVVVHATMGEQRRVGRQRTGLASRLGPRR